LLNFHPSAAALPGLSLAIIASTFSCAAVGLWIGAFGLRGRSTTALNNAILVAFLLLTGANVPISRFPGWVQAISGVLPLTHGIKAGREILAGASVSHTAGLLLTELAVGTVYTTTGVLGLKLLEAASRRTASLETF
jgi:ABC-2 type transport system permease protein